MTQTAWAHLPNAEHIDRILASLKANPQQWTDAWNKIYPAGTTAAGEAARAAGFGVVWEAARRTAWYAAMEAARGAAPDAVRYAAWGAAHEAARDAVRYAISALIAYDDCAYMLESEVGELRILAALGDQKAILLVPACLAFSMIEMEEA